MRDDDAVSTPQKRRNSEPRSGAGERPSAESVQSGETGSERATRSGAGSGSADSSGSASRSDE